MVGPPLLSLPALLAGCAAALVFVAGASAASPVYRCGASYQQTPCDAQGRKLDLDRAPTDAERAEADAVAQREAALAARMTEDRRRSEAAQRPTRASGFDARAERQSTGSGKAGKGTNGTKSGKKRSKRSEDAEARRQAEENGTAYRAPPVQGSRPTASR